MVSCTVPSCASANVWWLPLGNPTNKATSPKAASSSNGNLFVPVRFGGVPITVEEVGLARFCCLLSWKNTGNTGRAALGHHPISQKNSRRLELSISKNTPHGRWGQGPGSADPRFPTGLPFPVPEILEFVAFRDSGKIFQQFSRSFPGTFLQNSCTDPGNSHSLLEFSEFHSPCLVKKGV